MLIFLQIAPLIGGAILIAICLLDIVRNRQISAADAALLAFGALLFASPPYTNFNFGAFGLSFSAQGIQDQVQKNGNNLIDQGAAIKLELTNIKQALDA